MRAHMDNIPAGYTARCKDVCERRRFVKKNVARVWMEAETKWLPWCWCVMGCSGCVWACLEWSWMTVAGSDYVKITEIGSEERKR